MKNIERYPNTEDALGAFREWYKDHRNSVLTMSGWLEAEYEAPPQPTLSLLEAAEAVVDEWWASDADNVSTQKIVDIENAIAREKAKPVRNFDRFATQEEAVAEFLKICDKERELCEDVVAWLYEEVDKEKMK